VFLAAVMTVFMIHDGGKWDAVMSVSKLVRIPLSIKELFPRKKERSQGVGLEWEDICAGFCQYHHVQFSSTSPGVSCARELILYLNLTQ
jgi:hypothetical protein